MIEKLPGHNFTIPQQHFTPIPARPVIPTAAFAKTLTDAISKISEDLSPEHQAHKAAEMAKDNYLRKIYESGNPNLIKDPLFPYKARNLIARTNWYNRGHQPAGQAQDPTNHFRAYAAKTSAQLNSANPAHNVGGTAMRNASPEEIGPDDMQSTGLPDYDAADEGPNATPPTDVPPSDEPPPMEDIPAF